MLEELWHVTCSSRLWNCVNGIISRGDSLAWQAVGTEVSELRIRPRRGLMHDILRVIESSFRGGNHELSALFVPENPRTEQKNRAGLPNVSLFGLSPHLQRTDRNPF